MPVTAPALPRRLLGEFLGTALLVTAVVDLPWRHVPASTPRSASRRAWRSSTPSCSAMPLPVRSPALQLPTNLVAHHVKVLEGAGLVARSRSEGDRRRTYLRLEPDALASPTPAPLRDVQRVVFVCTQNSARSPLAEAMLRRRIVGRWRRPAPTPRHGCTRAPSAWLTGTA
jgi:hypothetical protein